MAETKLDEQAHSGRPTSASASKAVLALILITPAPSFGAFVLFWLAPGTTIGYMAYIVGKVWLYGLPLVWYLLVERGRIVIPKPTKHGLLVGAGLGVLISAVIWIAYETFASTMVEPSTVQALVEKNGIGEPLRYLGMMAYIVFVNALLEEYAFRWFIARQCEAVMPRVGAILLAALIFTLHHVVVLRAYFDWPVTLLASAGVFIGGVVWSWCFIRFRSLWPGYVSHAIVDIAVLAIGWVMIFGQPA